MTIHHHIQNEGGYWGPITSSIDWCEENYVHSYYIAEFWNTISSLAMILLGFVGIALHRKSLGWKLSTGYLLIAVVGVGSVLFHATLQYEHQMWDEVPMVWCACYMMFVLLEEFGYSGVFYQAGTLIYCAFATYVTSVSKGSTQFFLFQSSFGLVMWSDLYFVYKLYKGADSKEITSLFKQGTKFLALAIGVWLFDSNLCYIYEYVPNPQLHAWWHVMMCTSLHYFFVACGHEKLRRNGEKAKIQYIFNLFPFVENLSQKEHNK